MNWYYALEGQQVGPVTDAELQNLISAGTIKKDTLVWHEGMPAWQAYGRVGSPTASGAPGSKEQAGEMACSQCGRAFPAADLIRHGELRICAECKPVFLQRLKEGAALPRQLVYAGFWIRFGARLIDGIILYVVNAVVHLPFQASMMTTRPSDAVAFLGLAGILFALQVAFGIAYEVFFVGRYGATPGKMACRLKIVMPDGSPVTYGRAFARYFAYILSGITLMIGFIIAGFDAEKRALHDHICNTRVVRVR